MMNTLGGSSRSSWGSPGTSRRRWRVRTRGAPLYAARHARGGSRGAGLPVACGARRQEGPLVLRGLFLRTTRSLAAVAIGPAILLAILAPVLDGLRSSGSAWQAAGTYVAILSTPMYLHIFTTAPMGEVLNVLERQDLYLLREISPARPLRVRCGGDPAAIPASGRGRRPPSAAGCLTYAAYGLITWTSLVRRRSGPPPAAGQTTAEVELAEVRSRDRLGAPARPVVRIPAGHPKERRYILDVVLRDRLGLQFETMRPTARWSRSRWPVTSRVAS